MTSRIALLLVIALCAFSPIHGLKCHEGFDMTMNGIPLHYWKENECSGDSKCVGQRVTMDTDLAGTKLKSEIRYGACINSAYADYLDCENLFAEDSTFDPSNLLSMVPDIVRDMNDTLTKFIKTTPVSLIELLSNGTGTQSFVDGAFTFYQNLGFDLTEAEPLKKPLADMLNAALRGNPSAISQSSNVFTQTVKQMQTLHPDLSGALRSFFNNIGLDVYGQDMPGALLEKFPGLLRSFFPAEWQAEMWYDVGLKIVGNVNPANWTKTAEDMVSTIRSSYPITSDIAEYVDPVFNALPDLVAGSLTRPNYVGTWSLELLKKYSVKDQATTRFSSALTKFITAVTAQPPAAEFVTTIDWMPGLFYRMFPGDKATIQAVYIKMADGFNSFDFRNLDQTLPETKLSAMVTNVLKTQLGPGLLDSQPLFKTIIINFSKTFYNLMKVGPVDYTSYVDTFSTVIDDEFKKWPNINVGNLISKLITKLGGEVPAEMRPMLENIQVILTTAMEQPLNAEKLVKAFDEVIDSYKAAYPDSPFPELVKQYIKLMQEQLTVNQDATTYEEYLAAMQRSQEIQMELQYWNIDLQFAIIKSYDLSKDELYQMIVKAWPDYGLYIHMMQALNAEDVKQLMKDIIKWAETPPPHTAKGFVDTTKPTFQKIAKSLNHLMDAIRISFSPDTCKYGACDEDLCNSNEFVSLKAEFQKSTKKINWSTVRTATTTGSAAQTSYNIVLNIITILSVAKMVGN